MTLTYGARDKEGETGTLTEMQEEKDTLRATDWKIDEQIHR